MPAIVDKLRVTNGSDEKLDRRIKLTSAEKQTIREQYFRMKECERPTMTSLAKEYGVDRRTIQFILYPEREVRQRELARERRKDGRYYDKERHRKYMQNYRDYKRALVKAGKLNAH